MFSVLCPELSTDLPVMDEETSIAQCAEYTFMLELLQEILLEKDEIVQEMETAIETNDHMVSCYSYSSVFLFLPIPLSSVVLHISMLGCFYRCITKLHIN